MAMKNKRKHFTLHCAHLVHILLNKVLPQVKLEKLLICTSRIKVHLFGKFIIYSFKVFPNRLSEIVLFVYNAEALVAGSGKLTLMTQITLR